MTWEEGCLDGSEPQDPSTSCTYPSEVDADSSRIKKTIKRHDAASIRSAEDWKPVKKKAPAGLER